MRACSGPICVTLLFLDIKSQSVLVRFCFCPIVVTRAWYCSTTFSFLPLWLSAHSGHHLCLPLSLPIHLNVSMASPGILDFLCHTHLCVCYECYTSENCDFVHSSPEPFFFSNGYKQKMCRWYTRQPDECVPSPSFHQHPIISPPFLPPLFFCPFLSFCRLYSFFVPQSPLPSPWGLIT